MIQSTFKHLLWTVKPDYRPTSRLETKDRLLNKEYQRQHIKLNNQRALYAVKDDAKRVPSVTQTKNTAWMLSSVISNKFKSNGLEDHLAKACILQSLALIY